MDRNPQLAGCINRSLVGEIFEGSGTGGGRPTDNGSGGSGFATGGATLTDERVRRQPRRELYIVRWQTGRYDLDPGQTYRVQVTVGGKELGVADVRVARTVAAKEHRKFNPGFPLSRPRTAPPKSSVEIADLECWTKPLRGSLDGRGPSAGQPLDGKRARVVATCCG
jgi:hypothetical protein